MSIRKKANSCVNRSYSFALKRPNMVAAVVAMASGLLVTPVLAEDAGAGVRQLEEVIITARRREETLERAPVAVDVLSQEEIIKKGIATDSDLQTAVPGLVVRSSSNGNQINFAIRGQSLDAFSNTKPGVMSYFNEVQFSAFGGPTAYYDLQSIQVLNGPQGTLFGRNATGGAVLFATATPGEELGGYISISGGNFSHRKAESAIDVPLINDVLSSRISLLSERRDGMQKNLYSGEENGSVERDAARISLSFTGNRLANDLVVDYVRSGGTPTSSALYSIATETYAIPGALLTAQETMDDIIRAFGVTGYTQADADAYFSARPQLNPEGLAGFLAEQKERGPYEVSVDGQMDYDGESVKVSNITVYEISADTELKNVMGYADLKGTFLIDIDGSPYEIDNGDPTGNVNHVEQFSNELQLSGTAYDDHLTYVTGLYYAEERYYNHTASTFFPPPLQTAQINTILSESETQGIFAQGTHNMGKLWGMDRLDLTVGVRYTKEKVTGTVLPGDNAYNQSAAAQATYDFEQDSTYENLSWTVGFQYQLTDALMSYIASRHSTRNGGYNSFVLPVPGPGHEGGNGFLQEDVTDIEVGLKFSGELAGRPTRMNFAIFAMDIENAQRAAYTVVNGAPAAITVNVPESEVSGFQFDSQVIMTESLDVGFALNYTDAQFTDNLVSVAGGTPIPFDTYPDAPEWSGSVYANIIGELAGYESVFNVEVFGQSKMYFVSTGNVNPSAKTHGSGYGLTNLRWSISDPSAGWTAALNLKNAFDNVYYVGGIALGELFQTNTAIPGNRRTLTANVRYEF